MLDTNWIVWTSLDKRGRCWGQTSGSWQLWPSLSFTQSVSCFSLNSMFFYFKWENVILSVVDQRESTFLFWLLTVWCGYKQSWWHSDVNDAGDATQKLGWDAPMWPDGLILSAERVRCQHQSICIMPSIITFSLIIPRNPISILFTASS